MGWIHGYWRDKLNYYNDNDPYVTQWLQNLSDNGMIPHGHIDEREIQKVRARGLLNYTQCHFFAGIGGWSEALRLAGWPKELPVWTGSCPCQPFSVAGKKEGDQDERNLWPYFKSLIEECMPPVVFGEQVASPLGREWFSGVRIEMEALGYSVGASDLCAAGIGAPHIRQRLFWVAHTYSPGLEEWETQQTSTEFATALGNSAWGDFGIVPFIDGTGCEKWRRLGIGVNMLVDGFPGRVAQIRGIGNAIVPQVGAVFVRAFMETILEM